MTVIRAVVAPDNAGSVVGVGLDYKGGCLPLEFVSYPVALAGGNNNDIELASIASEEVAMIEELHDQAALENHVDFRAARMVAGA